MNRDRRERSDRTSPESRGLSEKRVFGKLPNSAARDPNLDPTALGVLAYRVTIASERRAYGLNHKHVKAVLGVGKNRAERSISILVRLGYLDRESGRRKGPDGKFKADARDRLASAARNFGASQNSFKLVYRHWFGHLLVESFALWLFLRAGTGKGPTVFRTEIKARFGWSGKTITKHLNPLKQAGLVEERRTRARGRYTGAECVALKGRTPGAHQNTFSGDGFPGGGLAGDIRRVPHHEKHHRRSSAPDDVFTSEREERYTGRRPAASLHEEEDDADASVQAHAYNDALASPRLLGWAQNDEYFCERLNSINFDTYMDVVKAIPAPALRALLRDAVGDRVKREMLDLPGLAGLRTMAVLVMEASGEEMSAQDAMAVLLNGLADRIGRKRGWLNSLALIGQRLTGVLRSDAAVTSLYGSSAPLPSVARHQHAAVSAAGNAAAEDLGR